MRSARLLAITSAVAIGISLVVPITAPAAASPSAVAYPSQGIRADMIGGNTVDEQIRETQPRADGYRHINTPLLIARLQQLHVNTYIFQIWNSPTDWGDLVNEFAPAAQRAGIQVWPYITPPSECYYYNADGTPKPRDQRGRCSQPYGMDYVAWAKAIANLSLTYPNVTNWAIDDFTVGQNSALFTTDYMTQIKAAQDAINPNLGLYTTAYYGTANSAAFYDKYGPFIKGIVFPYHVTGGNPRDLSSVQPQLDAILDQTQPRQLDVMFLSYTGRFVGATYDATPQYLTQELDLVRPYVADGRLQGIVSYGTAIGLQPAVSSQDKAATGVGRLSLAIPNGRSPAGPWATASQQVAVQPGLSRYTLSFDASDLWPFPPTAARGYFQTQLLVDGTVVWQHDPIDLSQHTYARQTVDVTDLAAGKPSVTVTFRLAEIKAVGSYPVDVSVDNLTGTGLTVRNGGFETAAHWSLDDNGGAVLPYIDIWTADLPSQQFDAIAHEFAIMAGEVAPQPPLPQTGPPANPRAMYGPGRLSLSLGGNEPATAGQCASASQVVQVDPDSPRYELSFWQYDQWGTPLVAGNVAKKVLIDGSPIYNVDVRYDAPATWIQGQELIGAIDVTDDVQGKTAVTLTFQICAMRDITDFAVDAAFDNVQTVGLAVANAGFDQPVGWTLRSEGNLKAQLDVAH